MLQIDDLGVRRLVAVPEVLGDHIAHAGNLGELVANLGDGEIEVLRADEKDVVGLALPDGAKEARNQLDEAARLLELLILLEEGDDILEARMERVGGGDFVGDGFGAAVGDFGLAGFFQLLAIGGGDVGNLRLVGHGFEEPLAEDVINFIGGEVDGGDVALLPAEFLTGVLEGAIDEPDAGVVGGREVGDHDADVGLLAGRGEEVGERARGDIGDGPVADLLGIEVVKIRRHFIEQDEDGLVTFEELQPVLLLGRFGTGRPERLELVALAELVGDFAPEEVVGIIAAIEGGDVGDGERIGVADSAAVVLAKFGMPGEKAEADEQVGLAAAHRLLQVEDGLGGSAGEPGDAFADEVLHALGDVGLLEEGRTVAFVVDQFIELLDLIAEFDGERVGLEYRRRRGRSS